MIRRLALEDMAAAARVLRASFDAALPWLAGLHTPAEDAWFFRERLFPAGPLFGWVADGTLAGVIAFRPGWVDQLYVLPAFQGRGAGRALLGCAQAVNDALELWTFQRNEAARRFYAQRGFTEVDCTDGSRNEEREPDVRLRWVVGGDGFEPPTLSV